MSRLDDLNFDPQDFPARPRPSTAAGILAGFVRAIFALGAVAAVGGAVYFGLRHSATVTDDGGLPLIKADLRPLKFKPAQPGGEQVPNQDKLVFDRLDPDSAPPMVERLLPPPEVPLPRPVAPPAPPPRSETANANANAGTAAPRYLPDSALRPPPIPQPDQTNAAATPEVAPPPAPKVATPPAATPPAKAPGAPATPAKPPAATPPTAAVPAGGGRVRIQLASVRSEAEAQSEWKRLQAKHHDQLGSLGMSVAKVDLADKGVYYRIQAGPIDEAQAHTICAQLQSQKVGCQLVKR